MRDLFFKILPYAMGCAIGLLMFFPPAFFETFGIWRPLILGVLVAVAILASSGAILAMSLPQNPVIERVAEVPPAQAAALIASLHELGFESVDQPLRVDLRPPAIVWMLVHREFGCWSTVYRTSTVPQKVSYDIVTIFAGGSGVLTSVPDPGAAVFPLNKGSYKQGLNGAAPRELLMFHLAAQDYLAKRGARFETPVLSGIDAKIRKALMEQRRAVMANPVKAAALLWWRVATKSSPHMKPLAEQR